MRYSPKEPAPIKLSGKILHETAKAIHFKVMLVNEYELDAPEPKNEWFPLSQIVSISKASPRERVENFNDPIDHIVVRAWIVEQKNLKGTENVVSIRSTAGQDGKTAAGNQGTGNKNFGLASYEDIDDDIPF